MPADELVPLAHLESPLEATIAEQLESVSEAARAKAKALGPGPVSLLWNSFATQIALQAATARGIEAHPSAPGVTEAPTHG